MSKSSLGLFRLGKHSLLAAALQPLDNSVARDGLQPRSSVLLCCCVKSCEAIVYRPDFKEDLEASGRCFKLLKICHVSGN